MAKRKATVEVIPSARRLIRSLRDLGYDFKLAVADIIDNSIAANASSIAIDMKFDGKNSWLRIADNGTGMSGTTITEAMRFGTEREYEDDELGKFGLGLKTASLSQCSRLTVASRVDVHSRRIEVRQWDLEHVEDTNRWEIIDVPAEDRSDTLIEPLQERRGTVVLWEVMNRVIGYKIPWGEFAKNGFYHLADELDLHLGMVFHRFLSGEAQRKKQLKISINGTAIRPWDPFAREEKATLKLPKHQFKVTGDDGPGLVAYAPYVLPSQEGFSTRKAFDRYAGPEKWNYQQGFYVYRADRMIQSGGWSRIRTSDEHTKLARVALDFWPDLDSAFDLNVAKAKVILPADLREKLQPHVEQLIKQAKKVYSPPKEEMRGNGFPTPPGGHKATGASRHTLPPGQPDVGDNGTGREISGGGSNVNTHIGKALESAAAKAKELKALKRIQKALKAENPDTAAEIGW